MLFSFSARSTMYWTCSFVRIKWQLQLPPYKGANHFKDIHEAVSRAGLSISLISWNRLSRRTAKLTKWPARQVKSQINLGIHLVWSGSLWSVATHWVHSEDTDQTGRMPRLICVFAVRTYHFVCFVLLQLSPLFPCCPKSKSSFPTFPVVQNCLCAPVPLIFRPQFPCSPEINAFVPKTPAWAHHTSMTSGVKQFQLSARSCTGSQCDMIT